jgi:hypothetical protein
MWCDVMLLIQLIQEKLLVCWNSDCEVGLLYWMWQTVCCVCVRMCTCVFYIYLVNGNSSRKSLSVFFLIAQTCKQLIINEVTVQGHVNDRLALLCCIVQRAAGMTFSFSAELVAGTMPCSKEREQVFICKLSILYIYIYIYICMLELKTSNKTQIQRLAVTG